MSDSDSSPPRGHSRDRGACLECTSASRRSFLRDAIGALAAGLVASGAPADALAATPVFTRPLVATTGATRTYPVPAKDGVSIDKANGVILVRWEGKVYAFNLSCPHQNTALRWNDADDRFQCPRHKSRYRPNGEFIDGRATRGMDRLTIRLDGTNVVVDLDHMIKQDEQPAEWSAAVVAMG